MRCGQRAKKFGHFIKARTSTRRFSVFEADRNFAELAVWPSKLPPLRVNRVAKEFKGATLELEIRLVPRVDGCFYACILVLLFAVYQTKTCSYYDVDKYVT